MTNPYANQSHRPGCGCASAACVTARKAALEVLAQEQRIEQLARENAALRKVSKA